MPISCLVCSQDRLAQLLHGKNIIMRLFMTSLFTNILELEHPLITCFCYLQLYCSYCTCLAELKKEHQQQISCFWQFKQR